MSNLRQKVLVLYLKMTALESKVIAWATYDGTEKKQIPNPGVEYSNPFAYSSFF